MIKYLIYYTISIDMIIIFSYLGNLLNTCLNDKIAISLLPIGMMVGICMFLFDKDYFKQVVDFLR
jgi:hypothetical protein